jgi:short-subunit dehydrogenase
MKDGKRVVIPGWKNRLLTGIVRAVPRSTVTKMVGRMYAAKSRN